MCNSDYEVTSPDTYGYQKKKKKIINWDLKFQFRKEVNIKERILHLAF